MPVITVRKLDPAGREMIRWSGKLLAQDGSEIVVEARFGRATMDLGYLVLATGDRMVEHYYTDRWYSIFEVFTGEAGPFRGWYCNIVRPAVLEGETLDSVDLALDLFVPLQGEPLELDRDEFEALDLLPEERGQALSAFRELLDLSRLGLHPFERRAETRDPSARPS